MSLFSKNSEKIDENEVIFQIDSIGFAKCIFVSCITIEIVLVLMDAFFNYGHFIPNKILRRIFNIAREDSLASWFAISQTTAIAGVAALLSLVSGRIGKSKLCLGWLLSALFFLYLAADDAAQIHERIGTALQILNNDDLDGSAESFVRRFLAEYPSYAWHILLPVFASVGVTIVIFWWYALGKTGSRAGILAAIGCFVFAIGLDILEGIDGSEHWLASQLSLPRYTIRHFSKALEEFIEMLGMTFILVTLLKHLGRSRITIRMGDRSSRPPKSD